jgi:hypothetical protein
MEEQGLTPSKATYDELLTAYARQAAGVMMVMVMMMMMMVCHIHMI